MTGEEKRKRITEHAEQQEIELLLIPDMDDAIIGIGYKFNDQSVVYDAELIIEILMKNDGITHEQAEDHFSVNIAGGYLGEHTPIFLTKAEDLV